jgi:hypothetical protein
MITSTRFETKLPFALQFPDSYPGLSQVFAAAVVNQGFRNTLLNDPETALKQGYLGRSFAVSREETALLVSINAKSLTDLARQVVQTLGS